LRISQISQTKAMMNPMSAVVVVKTESADLVNGVDSERLDPKPTTVYSKDV
jgi:hypothetical protein